MPSAREVETEPEALAYVADRVADLLLKYGLSYGKAVIRSKHHIKRATWSLVVNGQQEPSRRVLDALVEMFPDEDLVDLFHVLGYLTPAERRESFMRYVRKPKNRSGAAED